MPHSRYADAGSRDARLMRNTFYESRAHLFRFFSGTRSDYAKGIDPRAISAPDSRPRNERQIPGVLLGR